MPAYFIVNVQVTDPQRYEEYRAQVLPTLEAHGGRFLVRGGAFEVMEGEWPEGRYVVLEFPSVEQARAWYHSEEYAPLLAMRLAASESRALLVEGVSP